MFGAVSGSLLLEVAKMNGYMQQLCIPTAPMFTINPEFLSDLTERMSYITENGVPYGYTKAAQHPSAKALWDYLYNNGYVEKANWANGDVVLKPFYINRMLFDVGDKFVCSAALKYTMEKWMETDEYHRRGVDNE